MKFVTKGISTYTGYYIYYSRWSVHSHMNTTYNITSPILGKQALPRQHKTRRLQRE